jgi:hypothetical protein
MSADFDKIEKIAMRDIAQLQRAEKSYGDSWRKRGGVGAFMMLARKFDRIENQSQACHWDVFGAILDDMSSTGILDDIRDLRCYLLLVEEYATRLHEELKLKHAE